MPARVENAVARSGKYTAAVVNAVSPSLRQLREKCSKNNRDRDVPYSSIIKKYQIYNDFLFPTV